MLDVQVSDFITIALLVILEGLLSADNALVVRDDVGDCSQGWQLTADKEILLCPDTCNQVKSDANAKVNVVFGCGSMMDPIIR